MSEDRFRHRLEEYGDDKAIRIVSINDMGIRYDSETRKSNEVKGIASAVEEKRLLVSLHTKDIPMRQSHE